MNLNFYSLSSGSSGNCYYLGNGKNGILVDAGISATSVRKFLNREDIPMQSIMGILVTHNHTDHIKGIEVLTRKYAIPVFTTHKIWKSIVATGTSITSDCIRNIHLKQNFILAGFEIEAFPVCHDAPETIGFSISSGSRNVTISTDLGHICQNAEPYLRRANLLVIESNYDEEMLVKGRYPHFLKARIRSSHGHLGNRQVSEFLAGSLNETVSHICLAHLSKNNNTPEKALETLLKTLSASGVALTGKQQIIVLNRDVPTEMISLGDNDWRLF